MGTRGRIANPESRGHKAKPKVATEFDADIVVVPVEEQVEIPEPPLPLSSRARVIWDGLWLSPVSRVLDVGADSGLLARWIGAVDEYFLYEDRVRLDGVTVINSSGAPVMSPEARYLKSLDSQIARMETQLGLSPVARARLGLAIAAAELTAQQINAMAQGTLGVPGIAIQQLGASDDEGSEATDDLWDVE